MTTSTIGMIAGLLVAIAAAVGGFPAALLALVLGALGYLVGGHVDGEFDLTQAFARRNRG